MRFHAQNSSRFMRRGFSLLELLAVVTILGIIAVVAIPRISTNRAAALLAVARQGQSEIRRGLERYFLDRNRFTTDINGFLHNQDGSYVDPRFLTGSYQDFTDAGFDYRWSGAPNYRFDVTRNGTPIDNL